MFAQRQGTREPSAVVEPAPYRFTAETYHRLADAGILGEDDRVELINGEIIQMSPIGPRHADCVDRLMDLLISTLRGRARVRGQNPLAVGDESEPEPDVAVLRSGSYGERLPVPEDVFLLIEVSDTTLAYDRAHKLPLYARAGIKEVWIVDLQTESVERHTNATETGYQTTLRVGRGDQIESTVLPGLVLSADLVLPDAR